MNTNIKRGIVTGALSLSLLGGSVASVAADHQGNHQGNLGGAAGVVAAVVQANLNDTVDVVVADSFNNLRALNNLLNNNDINIVREVTVTDVIDVGNVTVGDVLSDNNVVITDLSLVTINLLSSGDLLVVTQ